jgi:nucleotide-binding universal stress UspA family protein
MSAEARPLLIGYDGSDDAKQAIRLAGALLPGRAAVVGHVWTSLAEFLLHTDVQSLTGTMKEAAEEVDASDRERAEQLAAEGAELARASGLDASAVAARGKPKAWPALLELADRHDAAAVVVGSRGLAGVKSALLGSVSAGVLHHSSRPVLVVPPLEDHAGDGPVVIGYDGSEQARAAIERAGPLLAPRAALVVTAWRSYADVSAAAALAAPANVVIGAERQIDEEILRGAEAMAAEGAELARGAGLEAEPRVERARGSAWITLVDVARDAGAAVLLVGSHGRSALGSAVLGSVSLGCAHHAAAPVLVVPAPNG